MRMMGAGLDLAATRPSAGMTRFRFKGHRTAGYAGLPRYLSPVGGTPLGNPARCAGFGKCVKGGVRKFLERVTGIEPAQPAWKAGTLPLSYTRVAPEPSRCSGITQSLIPAAARAKIAYPSWPGVSLGCTHILVPRSD